MEIVLEKEEQKKDKDNEKRSKNGPRESQKKVEKEILLLISC